MFKLSLLLLLGSAAAHFSSGAKSNKCYDVVEDGKYEWLGTLEEKITITSDVNTVVFTKVDPTATELRIETQFFPKAGMTADFTIGTNAMTVDVGEKAAPVDETSGATSIQGSAVAYVAAILVAMISVWSSPPKTSLNVLLLIGLAMSAASVESTDGNIDCATYGKESRVIILIIFPTQTKENNVSIDTSGLTGLINDNSALCGNTCSGATPECLFELDGTVDCGPAKGAAIADLVSFSWLDENCVDTNDNPASSSVGGIVIFAHGWQNGAGLGKTTPCWKWGTKGGVSANSGSTEIAPYIEADWQVGNVHWERFADEREVKDAEAKIWTRRGNSGMRYRKDNGDYGRSGNRNVAYQLYPMVKAAIKTAANSGVRIIFGGHSLGSQVITQLAYRYARDPEITTSVTFDLWLLDAFFSKGRKRYFGGQTNGQRMFEYVTWLQGNSNIRVHRTKTSTLAGGITGDAMRKIDSVVMFSEHKPDYFALWEIGEKHESAYIYWLRSIKGWGDETAPPDIMSTSDKSKCKWVQSRGQRTVVTTDDEFRQSGTC